MKPIPTLSDAKLEELQEEFDTLLLSTNREGVQNLMAWLKATDFYTAPASAANHGAIRGGLILHSVSVYRYLENFVKPLGDTIPKESVIISALLHDICKINFYSIRTRNVKVDKRWEEEESYFIEDTFPLGHGEKSIFLAMRHIQLTDDEALAIRWHMGGYDDASRSYASAKTQASAFSKSKLAVALNVADMYVANLIGH